MLTEVGSVGAFIVRSKMDGAGYALTTKSTRSGDLLTYRVDMTEPGWCHIHGCEADEIFETVEALVEYYTEGHRASIGAQLSVPEGLWPFEFEDHSGEQAIAGATTGGWLQVQPDKRCKSNLATATEPADDEAEGGGEYIAIGGGDGEVNEAAAAAAAANSAANCADRTIHKLTIGDVSVPTAAELRSLSALAADRIKLLKATEAAQVNGHAETKQIRLDGIIDEHHVLPALSVV